MDLPTLAQQAIYTIIKFIIQRGDLFFVRGLVNFVPAVP